MQVVYIMLTTSADESTCHHKSATALSITLISAPFNRIVTGLVIPLERCTQGYHFVLILVDYSIRYPKALPLHNISVDIPCNLPNWNPKWDCDWTRKALCSRHGYYVRYTIYWGLNQFAPVFTNPKLMDWSSNFGEKTFVSLCMIMLRNGTCYTNLVFF